MSGHIGWTVAPYLGSSTRKIFLAGFHLLQFTTELAKLSPQAFTAPSGPDDPFVPLDAHADACVLQVIGAFDAFSCAAAWHFGLGVSDDDRDRFSFDKLNAAAPQAISMVVGRLASSARYKTLKKHRNRAGHRGVVSEKRSYSAAKGLRLETVDRIEVVTVLQPLFAWTQGAIRLLQGLACLQLWPGHDIAYLLSMWPVLRIP